MISGQTDDEGLAPNWQLTDTTVQCDVVASEATIIVYEDFGTSSAFITSAGDRYEG
ncbi:MAG: hypothetical protein HQ553_10910 [Chloroflexi bacterium]|nr:hypothetical protein [Chloroflexota bacterium]